PLAQVGGEDLRRRLVVRDIQNPFHLFDRDDLKAAGEPDGTQRLCDSALIQRQREWAARAGRSAAACSAQAERLQRGERGGGVAILDRAGQCRRRQVAQRQAQAVVTPTRFFNTPGEVLARYEGVRAEPGD